MTTENPTSLSKRPLEGSQPPDRSASPGGGPVWVRDGKTPIEHMFSGLPQIADIVENAAVSIALYLTE
jgi:hypothetical protein